MPMRLGIMAALAHLFNAASLENQPGRLSRKERRRQGVGRADPRRFDRPPSDETEQARRRWRRRAKARARKERLGL
jgi:hypothetical protein